jgi:hypothetical protein
MKTAAYASERSSESSDWLSHGGQLAGRSFGPQAERDGTGGIDLLKGPVFAGGMPVRAKLTIGESNDKYEQEADRVAEQVMSMPDSLVPSDVQRNDLTTHKSTHIVPQTRAIQRQKDLTGVIQRDALPDSDYEREIIRGGRSRYTPAEASGFATNGANDARMAPKSNAVSDTVNAGVNTVMDFLGYDTRARSTTEDNDFYRDYAQYMPGYNIDGIPSGAWAQNAATNHVGHGTAPGNPWDNVRRSLVSQETSMIHSDLAAGGTGKLSFWNLYNAHENAYDTSGGGGNGFIDPASFALAVYGAPALEAVGIDSGPFTGASIDIFNNPEDSATEGWAKRMGLAGAEILGGGALAGMGVRDVLNGNVLSGGAEVLGGAGLAALGGFGAVWNTASAIEHGMVSEVGSAASDAWDWTTDRVSNTASDAWNFASEGLEDLW